MRQRHLHASQRTLVLCRCQYPGLLRAPRWCRQSSRHLHTSGYLGHRESEIRERISASGCLLGPGHHFCWVHNLKGRSARLRARGYPLPSCYWMQLLLCRSPRSRPRLQSKPQHQLRLHLLSLYRINISIGRRTDLLHHWRGDARSRERMPHWQHALSDRSIGKRWRSAEGRGICTD